MSKPPVSVAGLCTAAMAVVGLAMSNLVYGLQGGHLEPERLALTGIGLLAGGGIIHVAHCIPTQGPG